MRYIVGVGAIYIDTILTVPHFPKEDAKLRASAHTKRRGGNCGNTLEVLQQLLPPCQIGRSREDIELFLLSVLPSRTSAATTLIQKSLPGVKLDPTCIYRHNESEAASSYIIQNASQGTRTIVSYNGLEEMIAYEFYAHASAQIDNLTSDDRIWYHFEGRVPDVTLDCAKYLRASFNSGKNIVISVELEKPDRVGMIDVAREADYVFYSKLWAEHYGFLNPRDFLEAQIPETRPEATLCCTWGADGATVVRKSSSSSHEWIVARGYRPTSPDAHVVDTIGAGDTFIAGMLFAFNEHRSETWSLDRKVNFANQLAGRKVYQEGFGGLGGMMLKCMLDASVLALENVGIGKA